MAAHNAKKAKGVLGGLFGKKEIVQDTEAERVHLSCKIVKINKYGINQTRIILITQKNIYNLTEAPSKFLMKHNLILDDQFKVNRQIAISRVDAITMSTPDIKDGNEILIHVGLSLIHI